MNFSYRFRFIASRAVACLALFVAGCEPNLPGKPKPQDKPVPADKVLSFDILFLVNCSGCHGDDGMKGPAPPLNDPLFRAIVPASEIKKVLDHGRPGTSMPAFLKANGGSLTAEQTHVLIDGIKGSSPWGAIVKAPASTPPYALPNVIGSVEQGAKLFARACANCHGPDGQGTGDDHRNALNDRAFLSLISDQAIHRIMITGRPDLHMPDYSQKTKRPDDFQPLTSQDLADLGALMGFWRQGRSTTPK